MADTIYVGRRKTAIARVFLRPGKGEVKVNDKKFEEYFPIETSREDILIPF